MSVEKDADNPLTPSAEGIQTSETRYRRLFESARDGILILDAATGKITDANPFMIELLGYAEEEFLGRQLWQIGLFADEAETVAALNRLRKNHCLRYEDLPLETKAGERRAAEFVGTLYAENNRRVIQCDIRDITERKKVGEKLRESEQRYRRLVEMSPEAVVVHSEGKIVFINRAGAKLFGASSVEQMIGLAVSDFVPEDYLRLVTERIARVKDGEFAPLVEEKYFRLDGKLIDVEVAGIPITYNGKPAVQAVVRDVTERKIAEESSRKSLSLLTSTFEATADGIAVFDSDFNLVNFNNKFLEMWRVSEEMVKGFNNAETMPYILDQLSNPTGFVRRVEQLQSNLSDSYSDIIEFKDGRVYERYVKPQMLDGSVIGQVLSFRDITERKSADRAIKESAKRYRIVAETASDVIITIDERASIVFVNSAAETVLGYKPDELTGGNLSIIIPERLRAGHDAGIRRYMQTGERNIP